MKITFEGETVWVRDLDKLVENGLHFACIGKVLFPRKIGNEFYVVQLLHGTTQRLEMAGLYEEEDWIEVPRS